MEENEVMFFLKFVFIMEKILILFVEEKKKFQERDRLKMVREWIKVFS